MPSPSTSQATLRPDLGASFQEFDLEMNSRGFIAQRVLPVINTMKQAGPFGKIPLEQLLQNPETSRAPGAGYNRGNWTFTKDSYATEEHGWEEPIDDREAEMYSDFFVAEQIAAARALNIVLSSYEQRVSDLLFNATTFTPQTVTNEWDDYANATPIDDVETAVQAVWDASGLWPNAMILNYKVFRNLRQCQQIRDRIASSGAGESTKAREITEAQIANVFDLDEIIVAGRGVGGAKNTAAEGQAASIAPLWSNEYAMVARVATSQDIREPAVGRTFHWDEDGSDMAGTHETYRDETKRSDIERVRMDTDEKVLYVEAAKLLDNITT